MRHNWNWFDYPELPCSQEPNSLYSQGWGTSGSPDVASLDIPSFLILGCGSWGSWELRSSRTSEEHQKFSIPALAPGGLVTTLCTSWNLTSCVRLPGVLFFTGLLSFLETLHVLSLLVSLAEATGVPLTRSLGLVVHCLPVISWRKQLPHLLVMLGCL